MEIQIANEGDYEKPTPYYWAQLYTEQVAKGRYEALNKTRILHFISTP